jgi:hypothetical protein
VNGDKRVVQFLAEMRVWHGLQGLVTLHGADGENINQDLAFIGDVVASEKTLYIRCDRNVSVGYGGIAGGATATAGPGKVATAHGGYARGGGAQGSLIFGGVAFGGNGRGAFGRGGDAMGGAANNHRPGGTARAGIEIAGLFIAH